MPDQMPENPSGSSDSGTPQSGDAEADDVPKPGWGKMRRSLVLGTVLFVGAGALLFHLNRDENNPSEAGVSAVAASVDLKAERERIAAQARADEERRAAETAAREQAERERIAALARTEKAAARE